MAASSRPAVKPFKQRANTQISEGAIASVSTKPAEPISEGETVSAIAVGETSLHLASIVVYIFVIYFVLYLC